MMSATTAGYTGGAFLLWLAGILGTRELVASSAPAGLFATAPLLADLLVPAALAWTLVIAGYLVWSSLTRHDEERLLTELEAAYGAPPESAEA
jgi:hypothetical protein